MGKEKGTVKVVTVTVYTITFEKLDEGSVNGRKQVFSTVKVVTVYTVTVTMYTITFKKIR